MYSRVMSPYDVHRFETSAAPTPLADPFGRVVRYLRLSVTDRCDLRCVYCMAEHMTFLPKAEVLSLEELDRVASAFIALGTKKLRLTGGEPLVRKGVLTLVERLARHLASGALEELTLTTNIDDRISVGNIYNSGGCICYTGGDESQVRLNNKYIYVRGGGF